VETLRAALMSIWRRDTLDHLVNNAVTLLPVLADCGRIISFSSGLTRVSFPGSSAYSAAKGAVEIPTVCMAKELGSRGISTNTVAPGAIETDFLDGAVRDIPDDNQAFAGMTARPRRRARRSRVDGRKPARSRQPLGERPTHRRSRVLDGVDRALLTGCSTVRPCRNGPALLHW